MAESLFTKLASYSQNTKKRSIENFLTEVLAYLINTDRVFARVFVRHIIPDRRMQRGFRHPRALTQQTIGRGIVDLVLTGRRGSVLVEVKIGAKETQTKIYGHGWVPQVRKYLSYSSLGVAFLTTRNVPSPDVKTSPRFLGHFFLEELEGHLDRDSLSATGKLLLDFMEEKDMNALKPFTEMELRNARYSFAFARKCKAMLDEVIEAIEPRFKKLFRVRTGFTRGHFNPTHGTASSCTRKFRYGEVRWVSVFLEPREGELGFGIAAEVPKKDVYKIKRHLDWKEEESVFFSWHPVTSSSQPAALAKEALIDARTLRTALNRVYY